MDIFIRPLTELATPPWNYVLGFSFLIMLLAPRLTDLYREFLDVQMGRRHLEFEKLRLEIIKLREELKALGVTQEDAALKHPQPKTTAKPLPGHTSKPSTPKRRGEFSAWCERHPRLAKPILFISQSILAFFMAVFALNVVIIPFLLWNDNEFGPLQTILLAIIYGVLAWLSYKGYTVTRTIRYEIGKPEYES